MAVRPEVVAASLGDLPQLLHQHHGLDELHVAELGVPVDVSRADQDVLPHLLVVWRDPILPAGLLCLQQCSQGDVVLGHHPVQHVLVTVGVLYGKLVKLYKLFLNTFSHHQPLHRCYLSYLDQCELTTRLQHFDLSLLQKQQNE